MSTQTKIQQGEKTDMSDKSQKQEMQDAKTENRIPKCLSCNHELYAIIQTQYDYIDWTWDEAIERYEKINSHGDADAPTHTCDECPCEHQNWDFLDDNSESDLGVSF